MILSGFDAGLIHGDYLVTCGHGDPINDPINDPIKIDGRELKIIELLREETVLTRKEMAARLDCSDSTIKRCLQSMVEKGVLKRIGFEDTGTILEEWA
jgi:predicted HTH transcriptional regulator